MKMPNIHAFLSAGFSRKSQQGRTRLTEQGTSLVELMVVVGVIGILAAAVGFTYQGWMGRYKIEKITKELYTDVMNTRGLAVTRSRMYFVNLVDANSYTVTEDTNDSGVRGDTVGGISDVVGPMFPKRVEYALNWNAAAPANQVITIDKRGIINTVGTISLTTAADVDPDYNCIVISQTRIKTGKMNGGNCDVR